MWLSLSECGLSAGSTRLQISEAFQHRVRKRQPEGGFAGLGGSPDNMMRVLSPPLGRSICGTADNRARV